MIVSFAHALPYASGMLAVGGIAALFIGSAIYDARMFKKRRHLLAYPGSRRYRKRPLVSVIIVAQSQAGLVETLQSTAKSSYRKREVIVVDNAARLDVPLLRTAYPTLTLLAKRQRLPYVKAQHGAVAKSKGEIIVYITPGTRVHPTAFKNMVEHFLIDDNLGRVCARKRYVPTWSVTSHILYMRSLIEDYMARLHSKNPDVLEPFVAYRNNRRKHGRVPSAYASDVWVSAAAPRVRKRQGLRTKAGVTSGLFWLLRVYGVILIGYTAYLAQVLEVKEPLLAIWLGFGLISLLLTLFDTTSSSWVRLWAGLLFPTWLPLALSYMVMRILQPALIVGRIRVRFSLAP